MTWIHFFFRSDYIWFPLLWKTIGCVRKVSNRNIGACLHEVGSQGTWNMWLILLVLIPIGWAAPGETTQKCHFWLISTSSLSVISWWHSHHIVYSSSHPSCWSTLRSIVVQNVYLVFLNPNPNPTWTLPESWPKLDFVLKQKYCISE